MPANNAVYQVPPVPKENATQRAQRAWNSDQANAARQGIGRAPGGTTYHPENRVFVNQPGAGTTTLPNNVRSLRQPPRPVGVNNRPQPLSRVNNSGMGRYQPTRPQRIVPGGSSFNLPRQAGETMRTYWDRYANHARNMRNAINQRIAAPRANNSLSNAASKANWAARLGRGLGIASTAWQAWDAIQGAWDAPSSIISAGETAWQRVLTGRWGHQLYGNKSQSIADKIQATIDRLNTDSDFHDYGANPWDFNDDGEFSLPPQSRIPKPTGRSVSEPDSPPIPGTPGTPEIPGDPGIPPTPGYRVGGWLKYYERSPSGSVSGPWSVDKVRSWSYAQTDQYGYLYVSVVDQYGVNKSLRTYDTDGGWGGWFIYDQNSWYAYEVPGDPGRPPTPATPAVPPTPPIPTETRPQYENNYPPRALPNPITVTIVKPDTSLAQPTAFSNSGNLPVGETVKPVPSTTQPTLKNIPIKAEETKPAIKRPEHFPEDIWNKLSTDKQERIRHFQDVINAANRNFVPEAQAVGYAKKWAEANGVPYGDWLAGKTYFEPDGGGFTRPGIKMIPHNTRSREAFEKQVTIIPSVQPPAQTVATNPYSKLESVSQPSPVPNLPNPLATRSAIKSPEINPGEGVRYAPPPEVTPRPTNKPALPGQPRPISYPDGTPVPDSDTFTGSRPIGLPSPDVNPGSPRLPGEVSNLNPKQSPKFDPSADPLGDAGLDTLADGMLRHGSFPKPNLNPEAVPSAPGNFAQPNFPGILAVPVPAQIPRPSPAPTQGLNRVPSAGDLRNMMPCRFAPDPVSPQIRADQVANWAVTTAQFADIGGKLGEQIVTKQGTKIGIGGKLQAMHKFQFLIGVWNVLGVFFTIHNAAMLSRNLVESVGDMIETGVEAAGKVFGFRDDDDPPIEFMENVGKGFQGLMTDIFGTENWTQIQAKWISLNRIITSAAQVYSNVSSLMDGARGLIEITANNVSRIGNAMKNSRILNQDAFPWMPTGLTSQSGRTVKLFQMLTNSAEIADLGQSIAGEVINIHDEAKELSDSVDRLKAAYSDGQELATGSPVKAGIGAFSPVENKPNAALAESKRKVSQASELSALDLARGESSNNPDPDSDGL